MKPIVSVIMPCYNIVESAAWAMTSVQRQTFKDWELIVVDDCSTDNLKEVVAARSMVDSRVKYMCTYKQSGSPVIPRNAGVKEAKGKYLAFLDGDDEWHYQKLDIQVKFMDSGRNALTYHDMYTKYLDIERDEEWSRMSTCHYGNVFPQLLRKNFIPTSSVMLVRELYYEYGPMDMSLDISHDWDLWLKIAHEHRIGYIDNPLGVLRMRRGSVISEVHKRRRESRVVIRRWFDEVDGMWYRKILLYYYLMEIIDVLPNWLQNMIRTWGYSQEKYK